jgi:hypothetical protein
MVLGEEAKSPILVPVQGWRIMFRDTEGTCVKPYRDRSGLRFNSLKILKKRSDVCYMFKSLDGVNPTIY